MAGTPAVLRAAVVGRIEHGTPAAELRDISSCRHSQHPQDTPSPFATDFGPIWTVPGDDGTL